MKRLYKIAKNFLIDNIGQRTGDQKPDRILADYLEPRSLSEKRYEKPEIFRRLLSSAQNSGRLTRIIGGENGLNRLAPILKDFNSQRLSREFRQNSTELFECIRITLTLNGVNDEPNGLWPRFSRTILSASEFMNQFATSQAFYHWADGLYKDENSRPALPMLIQCEIEGMGYALACDFLKELGYDKYGKPDVHLLDIFSGIGLCRRNTYIVQKEISRIAEAAGVSAFNVDKIFWLIGSGKLHKHRNLGNNGMIGSMKQSFIEHFNQKFFIKYGFFDTEN
jgi:hypothetical protein